MKGRPIHFIAIVMLIALFGLSFTSSSKGFSLGRADASQDEIRIGLLFGSGAATGITMSRDGGGSFLLPGNPTQPLLTTATAGSHSFTVTPGGELVWELGSFSTAAEALFTAGSLMQFSPTPVWNQGWRLWLRGSEENIRSAVGEDAQLLALINSEHIRLLLGEQQYFLAGEESIIFRPTGEFTQIVNKNRIYRGAMEIRLVSGRLTLINQLPLEQYLLGVVPWEMSPSWNLEALKAQAVAARTYALGNWYKFSSQGFNLCDTTSSQAYHGYVKSYETTRIRDAVMSTAGQVIMHNGRIINAVYHADCGGHTDDASNLWGSRVEYLLGRECGFCEDAPRSSWTYQTVMTGQDIYGRAGLQDLLRQGGHIPPDFLIDRIEPYRQLTESGFARRMDYLVLTDPVGRQVMITGATLYNILYSPQSTGPVPQSQRMWSRFFDLETDSSVWFLGVGSQELRHGGLAQLYGVSANGSSTQLSGTKVAVMTTTGKRTLPARPTKIAFPGGGWGHGVGMCQWGAQGMAGKGYNYVQILQYYYNGVELR